MSQSTQCCMPSPRAIGPLVLIFLKGFYIYGHDGHLGHVTQMRRKNFHSDRGSIWNLAVTGPVVSKEMFEECGQMMEPACTLGSPMSLKGQVS